MADQVLAPLHVAIVMDGNGRWAQTRGRPRIWGHKNGVESVRAAVEASVELGIKVLTLYAFSEENWGRPAQEVSAIMKLLDTYILKEQNELNKQNVKFRTIGQIDRLPSSTQKLIRETKNALDKNTGLILNIALSYGSHSEIVHACKSIASKVQQGILSTDQIDHHLFSKFLETSDLPEPDFLIRTSGEQRISNFLLWQLAYTELYFTPVHWPDFRKEAFFDAILSFQSRKRRFGLIDKELNDTAKLQPTELTIGAEEIS